MDDRYSEQRVDPPPVIARLQELVEEAKQGRAEALPKIRDLLDSYPQIETHYGDLAGRVEALWLDLLAGDDACVRESLKRQVSDWRLELLYDGDSPLEKLLVERIVTSWLMTRYFDTAVLLATDRAPTNQARFLQQQLDRAQKRHLAALKSLAEVRKLLS